MRWDRLFDDLEAQWVAESRLGETAEVADRTRRERATVTLVARLAAQSGDIEALLLGGRLVRGIPTDVGDGFVAVRDGHLQRLLALPAVVQVSGLSRHVAGGAEVTAIRRFGLPAALRAIARDRAPVVIDDIAGRRLTGTIDGVGADHIEVVEHALDAPRRSEAILGRRVVPLPAIVCVSTG